jgi:hypothetical protein
MRLTLELLRTAEAYINALKERELRLRGTLFGFVVCIMIIVM